MKKKTKALLLLLVLLLSVPALVSAAKYGYPIDVPAMKALEETSAFPVRVIGKTVTEEVYDVEGSYLPADVLTLIFRNDTDMEVTGFKVFWVAYDAEGITQKIDSTSMIADFNDSHGSPQLYSAELNHISFPAHSENSSGLPVHWDTFVGVRAMVAWYTDASGNTVENPDFPQWQNLAFGMVSGDSTELD